MTNLFSLIDYTCLQESDTQSSIKAFCEKALRLPEAVAAVCIYPAFIAIAKKVLQDTAIKIAVVANFPSGTAPLSSTLEVVNSALIAGATEIDLVFPYKSFLQGEVDFCFNFVKSVKDICPSPIKLKVILETGAYANSSQLRLAADLAIKAGADFLKTSTGKISIGATLSAVEVLLQAILAAPHAVGLKISGGIRTLAQAEVYLHLVESRLGSSWITPENFRIGASQLVDSLQA